jgi:Tfp pilus assembly protein PilZ
MTRPDLMSKRIFAASAAFGALVVWLAIAEKSSAQVVVAQPFAGVEVDASGVLKMKIVADPTGQLAKQRRDEARAALQQKNPQVAKPSKLRKISLNRLEEAVNAAVAAGKRPTEEMMYLAGLTRVEYVFCYPETKDIVIAGPAEPWGPDLTNRIVGLQTGHPVLELQDLIVALRAFPPGGHATPTIGCSIDPTQEGLKQLNEYMRRNPPRSPADTDRFAAGIKQALGMQTVTVTGIPSDTHFAHVLVEADYRMKLISIDLERPPVNIKSYVDRANPNAISHNALSRFYFVPDYQCVRVSPDDLSMQLVGEGVKLVGQDELVGHGGERQQSGKVNLAAKAFTEDFTKKYPQLSAAAPIYAQLRNLIDLSVVAAFIQQRDLFAKTEWRMESFGNETAMPVKTVNAPKQVDAAVNVVWRGTHVTTPIGGGVHINPHEALSTSNLLKDDEGKVSAARDGLDLKNLPKDRWWWD